MTYWELYNLIPVVVADNMLAINEALAHVNRLMDADETGEHREDGEKLVTRIEQQREQLYRIGTNMQKTVHQMALMSKMVEGFPDVEEMKVPTGGV